MRLLLDTHVAIWVLISPDVIRPRARDMIADPRSDVFVSAASIREIAIKRSLGRSATFALGAEDTLEEFRSAGLRMLDVTAIHAAATERLPMLHRDPFDRILVAQAMTEAMTLLSRDSMIAAYDAQVVSA